MECNCWRNLINLCVPGNCCSCLSLLNSSTGVLSASSMNKSFEWETLPHQQLTSSPSVSLNWQSIFLFNKRRRVLIIWQQVPRKVRNAGRPSRPALSSTISALWPSTTPVWRCKGWRLSLTCRSRKRKSFSPIWFPARPSPPRWTDWTASFISKRHKHKTSMPYSTIGQVASPRWWTSSPKPITSSTAKRWFTDTCWLPTNLRKSEVFFFEVHNKLSAPIDK